MTTSPRNGARAAVAISVFAATFFGGAPAFAQSFTVGNGQTVGQQTMSNSGDTGTVDSGGTIETLSAGENAVQMLNSGQSLANSGRIGTFGGNAFTVYSTGADASIVNNGLILGLGTASVGIVSEGDNANIVNKGSIEAVGVATFGIISNGTGAHVDNQGFIGVSGTASAAIIGDKSDLTISNSGSIEAFGQAASGILWGTSGPLNSGFRLTNSGSISVFGNNSTAIGAGGNDIVVVNTGTVSASGSTSTGIVTLFGNAAITNAGSVIVSGANSVSISAQGPNAVVTNSGQVFNDQSTAIFFGSSNGTLNLLAGTAIQGPITFTGSGNTVSFGPALNAVMTFSGSGVPQTILTGGRPFVVSGNQVAVVDVTGFASAGSLVEDLTDTVSGVIETRLTTPHDDVLAPRSGPDAWLATFGGVRSQDGSGTAAGFSQALGGVVAGAEKRSGDGFLGGVFVGGAAGETDVDDNAQEITHRSVFAGGYLGYDVGQNFANLSFIAGVLDERSSRRVANNLVLGGIETARADFNGTFVSPAITLGTRLPVSMGTLMPSVRLRYAGLFLGDYTETGSDADLAVARRNVHLFEARGQLALALPQVTTPTQAWQTSLRVGIDGIFQSSGDVSATLLGQDISFASGAEKAAVRGFAGADVAAAIGHGMMLDSGFEVGYGSDNAFTARGQIRLSKAF
ncbi:autotransporter domain-containing protein [Mesorhizobium sp.]|uniref:autotransporter outer membrane beta-barrel domain-containing protein n=1 Tax=Mesorhizobium sp. TaxID=1871066 RepID=UPI0025DBABBD|nr:autotransporter outer membrane beta-barrel domain-containing protein [Mesorhizobium sp.]